MPIVSGSDHLPNLHHPFLAHGSTMPLRLRHTHHSAPSQRNDTQQRTDQVSTPLFSTLSASHSSTSSARHFPLLLPPPILSPPRRHTNRFSRETGHAQTNGTSQSSSVIPPREPHRIMRDTLRDENSTSVELREISLLSNYFMEQNHALRERIYFLESYIQQLERRIGQLEQRVLNIERGRRADSYTPHSEEMPDLSLITLDSP